MSNNIKNSIEWAIAGGDSLVVSTIYVVGEEYHVCAYPTRREARKNLSCYEDKVVPVIITYPVPKK